MDKEEFLERLEECKKIVAKMKVKADKEVFYNIEDSKLLLDWQKEKIKKFIEKNNLNILRMFALKRLEDEKIIMYIITNEEENENFEYRVFFPEEGKANYNKRDITLNIDKRNLTDELKEVNFKTTNDMLQYTLIKNKAVMTTQVVNGISEFDGETKLICTIKTEGLGIRPMKHYREDLFTEEYTDITPIKHLIWLSEDNEEYREIIMKEIFEKAETEKEEKFRKLLKAIKKEGEKRNKELEKLFEEQEKNQEN